ncbi:MAG TPA: phospholipid ABC transporter ATP-binding protein MlaF, partial [Gammaproteobacteria bacterium]|nr:phospholipid ABC transporter ATP-binding protein MlaF [Gammaproteobacteria bacterium]
YIYLLSEGKVIGQGTPEQMMNSDPARVQQFMKGLPDGPVPFHYPASDYSADLLNGKTDGTAP